MSREIDLMDLSNVCNKDDNINNNCWECIHFIFPIGCMIEEGKKKRKINV